MKNDTSSLFQIKSGVPQGSILGPLLYLLFTYDLPNSLGTEIATFADDTAIISSNQNPEIASLLLQSSLNSVSCWLKRWRIKVNGSKCVHITFTTRRQSCPPVSLQGVQIPVANEVKYLGMHLDRRLTWRTHIFTKRKQLGIKLRQMYWLMGSGSPVSIDIKLLIYKAILRPIWTYGIQLWGTAANSNIEILQRFQSKTLRTITNSPWFLRNEFIHKNCSILTIKKEIQNSSQRYKQRLENHPNPLAINLMQRTNNAPRRLQKRHPSDLF